MKACWGNQNKVKAMSKVSCKGKILDPPRVNGQGPHLFPDIR